MSWVPEVMRSLWHYESQVYDFHVNLVSPHTYQSNPWSWLVLGRPVSYFYESPKYGVDGCTATAGCAREVLGIGTPLLWWSACFALLYVLYRWAFRRDWRAGAILCGVAAGYLPWFMYQQRTIFLFYAVVFLPFLCLALAMMLGAILGPRRDRTPPHVGRGGRRHPGAAHRLELHLLLPALHRHDDPDGFLAGENVARHLDLAGEPRFCRGSPDRSATVVLGSPWSSSVADRRSTTDDSYLWARASASARASNASSEADSASMMVAAA